MQQMRVWQSNLQPIFKVCNLNPGYHFVNNCNIGFQPSPWYKTFMAVNVNVFLGPNRIL